MALNIGVRRDFCRLLYGTDTVCEHSSSFVHFDILIDFKLDLKRKRIKLGLLEIYLGLACQCLREVC